MRLKIDSSLQCGFEAARKHFFDYMLNRRFYPEPILSVDGSFGFAIAVALREQGFGYGLRDHKVDGPYLRAHFTLEYSLNRNGSIIGAHIVRKLEKPIVIQYGTELDRGFELVQGARKLITAHENWINDFCVGDARVCHRDARDNFREVDLKKIIVM